MFFNNNKFKSFVYFFLVVLLSINCSTTSTTKFYPIDNKNYNIECTSSAILKKHCPVPVDPYGLKQYFVGIAWAETEELSIREARHIAGLELARYCGVTFSGEVRYRSVGNNEMFSQDTLENINAFLKLTKEHCSSSIKTNNSEFQKQFASVFVLWIWQTDLDKLELRKQ